MKQIYAAFKPTNDPSSVRTWTNIRGYGNMVIQRQPTTVSAAAPGSYANHPHALLEPLTDEASYLNPQSISRNAPYPVAAPCCIKHMPSNHHCKRLARNAKAE